MLSIQIITALLFQIRIMWFSVVKIMPIVYWHVVNAPCDTFHEVIAQAGVLLVRILYMYIKPCT